MTGAPVSNRENLGAAMITNQNGSAGRGSRLTLKDRYAFVLITVCTYLMRGFGVAHFFFQNIGENTRFNFFKSVAFLFCIPCFKGSFFFFKLAYLIQHRELVRVGRKCAALGGENLSLKFDGLRLEHGSVPRVRTY